MRGCEGSGGCPEMRGSLSVGRTEEQQHFGSGSRVWIGMEGALSVARSGVARVRHLGEEPG